MREKHIKIGREEADHLFKRSRDHRETPYRIRRLDECNSGGGGGRLQWLVQHKGDLLSQTQLVLLILGLHCAAVQGAHSNFCLRREREMLN